MLRAAVLVPAALFVSPGYEAVNVTDPAVAEVIVTLHELVVMDVPSGASTQDSLAEIEPDPPVAETVTTPVGEYPFTVTLHVEVCPVPLSFDGLHDSVTLLVACVTVRLVAAIDGALLRSPE